MFKDVIISAGNVRLKLKRLFIMAISLILHSAVVFAVIIGPLIKTDEGFSPVKVVDVFVKTVPMAPKAQRTRPRSRQIPSVREEKKKSEIRPRKITDTLIVPLEISEDCFKDEDIDLGDDRSGVWGGIEGEGLDDISEYEFSNLIEDINTTDITRIAVRQAKRVKYVRPVFPDLARKAHIKRATVIIEARTDVFGQVIDMRIISGHPLFNMAAKNAVKKWVYEPYLVGGVPRAVTFTVTINFVLN